MRSPFGRPFNANLSQLHPSLPKHPGLARAPACSRARRHLHRQCACRPRSSLSHHGRSPYQLHLPYYNTNRNHNPSSNKYFPVHARDILGRTPLYTAARDNPTAVRCLLEHGGDVNTATYRAQETPLMQTSKYD
ncbi:hypothetical protein L873DRAFT_1239166 [Choiromyces venosus 120613-1]|uniref:Uncharacterized protein n=1 Tax=Choiromyces venosus 120613-1 TaxID=1336337 RepID=A0A3N4JGI5_9PEZI|nr:hypothetical protein L873DRAFT_1239166 [Choiromyces venosus 120613-1]